MRKCLTFNALLLCSKKFPDEIAFKKRKMWEKKFLNKFYKYFKNIFKSLTFTIKYYKTKYQKKLFFLYRIYRIYIE